MLRGLVEVADCLKVGLHTKQYRKEHPCLSFSDNCILGAIYTFSYKFTGHTSVTRNLSQAASCSPPGHMDSQAQGQKYAQPAADLLTPVVYSLFFCT